MPELIGERIKDPYNIVTCLQSAATS